MTAALLKRSRIIRASLLSGVAVFALYPQLSFALSPDASTGRNYADLRVSPTMSRPLPKLVFPDDTRRIPSEQPIVDAAQPATIAASPEPLSAPVFPPVDAATAEQAAREMQADSSVPITSGDVAYIPPAPLAAIEQRPVADLTPQTNAPQPNFTPMPADVSQPAPEKLSDATKTILSNVPSKINADTHKSGGKMNVSRMSPGIQKLPEKVTKTETFDATGLSIKVQRQGLDTNFELNRAYTALMGGETTTAIETYKNILSTEPNDEDALFALATIYHRLGKLDTARPYYAKLLKINPNHRDGISNFMALVSDESPQEALAELERLEQRNPDFSAIPAQQALLLKKLGFADQAREKMIRAIELEPENLTYKYNLAIMLDASGQYTDASAMYRLLIDAALKGQKIPSTLEALQKRLNFIATASVTAHAAGS